MEVPEHEDLIARLAEQVLDGVPVDWTAAEAAAGTGTPAIKSLRTLDVLGRMHRIGLPTQLDTGITASGEFVDAIPIRWGHLQILEPVGRGASGDVYRAWDTRLDREVALKLLPADSAQETDGSSPVIHEGRLLARVRHPNVVTIYGAERIGDLVGLWMEFVRGRTLEEIARERIFNAAETIDIGVALCGAVAAVHGAGLFHRDIKAHNVMQASDGRVVLMDFGTGREFADDSAPDAAGTPLYLAPELFSGKSATVQSDVYSLGVLLFRLVTGAYPVYAGSIGELRRAHQSGQRVRVREAMPSVSAGLARAIERAIDPVPERRWPDAESFGASLLKVRPGSRLNLALFTAGVIITSIVIGLTTMAVLRQRADNRAEGSIPAAPASPRQFVERSAPVSPPPSANDPGGITPDTAGTPPLAEGSAASGTKAVEELPAVTPATQRPAGLRPSIQVVPFTNASGRASEAWLSATLAEMVLREFRASERYRWIPGAVPLAKAQLGQALITESSMTIRPVIPAEVVISGEYILRGAPDRLQVALRLQQGDRPPTTLIETGSMANLVELVSRTATRARASLGDTAPLQNRNSQPANAEAARWYAEGLDNVTSPAESAAAMERAIAADPRFAPAHIRLAENLMFVLRERDRDTPRAVAARAVELAAAFPREERTLIEIRARVVTGGPTPAREEANRKAYEELFELFPDTLLYGFMVARAYADTDAARALAAVDRVAHVPGAGDEPGLLRLAGRLASSVGDHARAQKELAAAERVAKGLGDEVLLGYVLLEQSEVAAALNDPVRQLSLAEDALQSFIAAGSPAAANHGRARVQMVYEPNGGFAWARKSYDQLIAASKIRGNRPIDGHLRARLAQLLADHGDLAESRALFEDVARDGTEVMPFVADASLRLGYVMYRQGQLDAALETFKAALADAGRSQDVNRSQEILARSRIAQVHFEQGHLQAALDEAERAVQMVQERGGGRQQNLGLVIRGRTFLARGETVAARQAVEEAAKTVSANRQTIQPHAFDVIHARALVALEEGRHPDARMLAQQAGDLARRDLQPDREADAAIVVALAWLAEGRVAEAETTIAPATRRVKVTEDQLLRLSGGVAAARVMAASKESTDLAAARQQLAQLAREAADIGAVSIELEARLALGEAEIQAGELTSGRARLLTLARDAAAKGFSQVAKKASAATN